MAFSSIIIGTIVSLTALFVLVIVLNMPALSGMGLALAAGQGTFALVLFKAMLCRSLHHTRRSDELPAMSFRKG